MSKSVETKYLNVNGGHVGSLDSTSRTNPLLPRHTDTLKNFSAGSARSTTAGFVHSTRSAVEVMVMTNAIENHIRKNETFKITSAIQTSRNLGMVLLDDFLWDLFRNGKITEEELMLKCQNPRQIREKMDLAGQEEPQKKGLFRKG